MRKILKKAFVTFLAITLLGGLNLSGVYANTEIADSVNSVSNFNFDNEDTEDTEKPTGPVDPEFPDHEIDPDDNEDGGNGSTGNTGRLRIDYVSDFAFGAHSIESGSQTFYAKLISASAEHGVNGKLEVPNFVQVSDLRGSGAGWTLYVKQDEPFKMVSGEMAGTTFEGMQITLNNIIANTVNDSGKVHVPNNTIPLNTMDEYKEILIANEGQGVGTHVAHFGEYEQGEKESALESVELFIPEDHAKVIGKYKTTLTWNLSSVPLNGGNGSDPELDYISITTAPDKTDYIVGETFNPDGMVVTAHYTDDSSELVTDYTWSPDGALSESDEIITVSYTEDDITRTAEQPISVSAKTLTSIAVTKAPAKTAYIEGEKFSTNGMEVTAYYNNGASEPVANYTYTPDSTTSLTTSTTAVTISYTEGSITKTAAQPITVSAKTLTSIAVTQAPTKTAYIEGEKFNADKMVVTAYYNNGTSKPVTSYTYTPNSTTSLTTSNTAVTISYTEGSITKTATQPITVAAKTLTSITVAIYPTTTYTEGEYFDTTGMWVYANYNNGTYLRIYNYTYSPTRALKTSDTKVTLSYTENGVTKTTSVSITVKEGKSEDDKAIDSIDDKEEFDEIKIGGDTWIILSKNKSKGTAELLHKKGLSTLRQYNNNTSSGWNWNKSTLRSYLNGEFYNSLSSDFQKRIQSVSKTTLTPSYGTSLTQNETVYLLSLSEYNKYENAFGGTLYKYGLDSKITPGWWTRDAERENYYGGVWYIVTDMNSSYYASHNATGLRGVRPALTVKYK